MKIKIILSTFVLGMLLASCSEKEKWPEEFRVEYVEDCTLSFIAKVEEGLGDLMSEVNKEKLDKLAEMNCSCMYESTKTLYDSAEEATSRDRDEVIDEVAANSLDCRETAAQNVGTLVK